MELETKRLRLRELAETDWPSIEAYQKDERYWRFYDREGPVADRRALLRRLIEAQAAVPRLTLQLAITLKEDGRLIGNTGIRRRRLADHFGSPDEADIGYELDPAFWRQGLATEAATAMLAFAFGDLRVHRVWAWCIADNEASWRLLERLGFTREARFRQNEWMQGRWWDTCIYGLLADEWASVRSNEVSAGS